MNNLRAPSEMTDYAELTAVKKTDNNFKNLFILSFLGGVYISIGGMFSTLIATDVLNFLPYGIAKTLMGLAFSLGLILVVVGGAELFTGSTVVVLGWLNGKLTFINLLKNWLIVYIGNFVGSLAIVFAMFWTKQYMFSSGSVGKTIFYIAGSKLHYNFFQAFVLGIMCNILVCLAIWLSYSGKSTVDKILAIIFPITAFIALSFEHSVANMYLITLSIVIKIFDPFFSISQNIDVGGISIYIFLLKNLLPVTLGNIVGGLIIWLSYWSIYSQKSKLTT